MKVTINRREFLDAARRALSVAPQGSPLDVLKCILLEADASTGKLTITATNLELSLEQKIPGDTQESGAIAVNAKLLAAMLEKLPGEQTTISRMDGKPAALFQSGDAEYLAPVWERGSFPKMNIPFPEDTVKVGGIPAMAKRTVFAASQEAQQPLLKCVDLMFTRDGLRAAGSNGVCLVSARGDEKSTGNIDLLMPALSLDKLAQMCGDQDEFQVGIAGKSIVFLKENFVFSARLLEGDYINTDKLIQSISNSFTVLTDVAELRKAIETAACIEPDGKILLAFNGPELTFRCRGTYANASSVMEVIPLTGSAKGEYWYLTRQLAASLRALSGTVTLGVAQGGMLTLSTENAFYMQTGLRPPAASAESEKAA